MCDIWKEKPKNDFSFSLFEEILRVKVLGNVKCFSFTGGEPFMIEKIKDYYLLIRKYFPKSYINISTNGYFKDRIIQLLDFADIKRTSITLSYDGIDSHDFIRGLNGSADKLIFTAKTIKKKYPDLECTFKFTITPWNYKEIFKTAVYAKRLNIPFHVKMIEELNSYTNKLNPLKIKGMFNENMRTLISQQLIRLLNLNIKTNKNYIRDIIKKNSGKYRTCNWSNRTLFIGLDSKVFLCRKKMQIGNININGIKDILKSKKAKLIKEQMRNCEDLECSSYHPN